MASREVFKLLVEADASGASSALRTFATQARQDLGQTKADADSLGVGFDVIGRKMAAAGAAGLAAFTALGLSAASVASETAKVQRVYGGTAEEASRLRFAAQQSGVELNTMASGLVKLSRTASSDRGADVLAAYGIAARDAEGDLRPLNALLADVAATTKRLDSGAERNAFVTSVFGKGGAELLPLLSKGADGLAALNAEADELGATIDQKAVESAKRLTAAQRDMTASSDAFRQQLGSGTVPVLATFTELMADVAKTGASALASLPDGIKETGAAVGLVGSGIATVAGSVVAFGADASEAADGVGKLVSKVGAAGGLGAVLGKVGPGVAAAATAVAGFTFAINENQRQFDEWVDRQASFAGLDQVGQKGGATFRTSAQAAANDIGLRNRVGPADAVDKIKDFFGLFGAGEENDNRAAVAEQRIQNLARDLASLSASDGKEYLDRVRKSLITGGESAAEATAKLQPLYDLLSDRSGYDTATDGMADFTAAADKAAAASVRIANGLANARKALSDGVDPGEMVGYIDTLSEGISVYQSAENAAIRLVKAQAAVAESAEKSSTDIRNAYQRLADAKEDLDRILAGDGNNLEQESPEAQIARARARVLEANAVLLRNPTDAAAQTKKDEALADEQRAIERRQQLKRDATDRDRQVRDAQRRISDAEQGVTDAQQRQTVGQGDVQTELRTAGLEYARTLAALNDAQKANPELFQQIGQELQVLVDTGILPQSAADDFKSRFENMGQAATDLEARFNKLFTSTPEAIAGARAGAVAAGLANRAFEIMGGGGASARSDVPPGRPLTSAEGLKYGLGDDAFEMNGKTTSDSAGRPWRWDVKRQRWIPEFSPPARGAGGVGFGGSMYDVNEFGIEGFRPSGRNWVIPLTTGTFLSAGRTRDAMANATSAAGGDSTVIHVHEQRSPRLTAQAVVREQRASSFRRGRL